MQDISEATEFHPVVSSSVDVATKHELCMFALKFEIHRISAMLCSKYCALFTVFFKRIPLPIMRRIDSMFLLSLPLIEFSFHQKPKKKKKKKKKFISERTSMFYGYGHSTHSGYEYGYGVRKFCKNWGAGTSLHIYIFHKFHIIKTKISHDK